MTIRIGLRTDNDSEWAGGEVATDEPVSLFWIAWPTGLNTVSLSELVEIYDSGLPEDAIFKTLSVQEQCGGLVCGGVLTLCKAAAVCSKIVTPQKRVINPTAKFV